MSDANTALSSDTGGRRIGLTNDFSRPLQGVMADASSYYLLGYESPATTADGKFRKIDVDVKRSGVRVIARNGYWAPRPEDLRTAATAAAASIVPPEVAEALDSLRDQARRTAVTEWIGLRSARLRAEPGDGRASNRCRGARQRRASGPSTCRSRSPTASRHNTLPLEGPPGVWPLRLEAPPGRLRTRTSVKKRRRRGNGQLGARHRGAAAGRQRSGGHPSRLPARQRPAVPRADGRHRGPASRRPAVSGAPIARLSGWRWERIRRRRWTCSC